MKHMDAKEMLRSIEDQAIETAEPILRQKVLEQMRRADVRLCVLLYCLLGPRQARKAISHATRVAAKQVGSTIRSNLPPDSQLAEGLSEFPRDVVNEELIHRLSDSIVTHMEGVAETTSRQELFRLIYWGSVVLFFATHAIHWILF